MTRIRRLGSGDEAALETFLSRHARTSMFLRSNVRRSGVTDGDVPYHGAYWAAFDGRSIAGVVAHYWNGNIIMQAPDGDVVDDLLDALRTESAHPVAGVLCPEDQAARTLSSLGLSDDLFSMNGRDELFALPLSDLKMPDKANDPAITFGPAAGVDKGLLTDWLVAYAAEALGTPITPQSRAQHRAVLDRLTSNGDLWVLFDAGNPVALSGFSARLPDMVQVGPVWTPPNDRDRHYARTLVGLTLRRVAEADGVREAILFTNTAPARRAYESLGFKLGGSYRLALLKTPVMLTRDARGVPGQNGDVTD